MDELCEAAGQKKPRMYRRRARKDYLRLSKNKKRSGEAIRSAVRKQLQYIRRDMGYIVELVQKDAKLSQKQADRLNIVTTVYEQQHCLHPGPTAFPGTLSAWHSPGFGPSFGEKAHVNTEFGAKLYISLVDGYSRIERLGFEPFDESEGLWRAAARYWERYGCYPERILADKIYRSRQTLAFCKEHGIRLSVRPWASRQKIRNCPAKRRNRSIRTAATATLWRVFSEQPRPLMAWIASWHAYRRPLPV